MTRGADRQVIDDAALAATTGGDAALALELLHIFRQGTLPDVLRLAEADDAETRGRLAHRLKGAALAIGAVRLAALSEAGDGDALRAEAAALDAEIARRLAAGP